MGVNVSHIKEIKKRLRYARSEAHRRELLDALEEACEDAVIDQDEHSDIEYAEAAMIGENRMLQQMGWTA